MHYPQYKIAMVAPLENVCVRGGCKGGKLGAIGNRVSFCAVSAQSVQSSLQALLGLRVGMHYMRTDQLCVCTAHCTDQMQRSES